MRKIYLYSLSSLAVISSAAAFADEGVYVPELEGGITASVGVFIATPSAATTGAVKRSEVSSTPILTTDETEVLNVTPGYNAGIDASLGYIFEDTANGIEVFYRNYDINDTNTYDATFGEDLTPISVSDNLGYELNTFDIMISQFMNIGQHMQMRFSAGASYLELEQNETGAITPAGSSETLYAEDTSEFRGWGPRLSIDARYDFGDDIEGLGIVAGGSLAYFLGDLDSSSPAASGSFTEGVTIDVVNNDMDNQNVTNLRGNVGMDYVYYFDNDEGSTLGIEIGYQVDFYDDSIAYSDAGIDKSTVNTQPVTFSGPYAYLKGVF
ncbi:MAG: Lpg1974 family pore-forming outer membrane protein [Gammaproteobacteria bacterium]|jgi:hypothetical protein